MNSSITIGFNMDEAEELMKAIVNLYENLGTTISTNWKTLVTQLDSNWVGEDEQGYCVALAEKTSKLYKEAKKVAEGAIDVTYDLTKAWHEFQVNNKIEGRTNRNYGFNNQKPAVADPGNIVTYTEKQLASSTTRGIVAGADQTLVKALTTFVENIVKDTETLTTKVVQKVNTAFFGNQTQKISELITEVGKAMGDVSTAISDMKTAINQLTTTNYNDSVTEVNSSMDKAVTETQTSVSSVQNRWGVN